MRRDGDVLAGGGLQLAVLAAQVEVDDGRGVVGVGEVDVVLAVLGGADAGEPEVGVGRRAGQAEQAASVAGRDAGGLLDGPAGGQGAVGGPGEGGRVRAVRGRGDGRAGLLQGRDGVGARLRALLPLAGALLALVARRALAVRLLAGRCGQQPGGARGTGLAARSLRSEGGVRGVADLRRGGRRAEQRGPFDGPPGGALGRGGALPVGGGDGGDTGDRAERRGRADQGHDGALHCWSLPSRRGSR